MEPEAKPRGRLDPYVLGLAALCALTFFFRLGYPGIFDLDEGLYASATREMVLRGDYVTPRVNGEFFFEKPPLLYWLAAGFFQLFGRSELTARLPSALASTVVVFLIFALGRRYFNRTAAFYAAAMYALSPLVMGAARQMTTDAVLDLCVAGALLSFLIAYSSEDQTGKRWYFAFWAATGFGILDKGIAGALPLIVASLFLALEFRRDKTQAVAALRECHPLLGIVILVAIALPWHILAWRANGDAFVQEYIIRQHLQRFKGGDEVHRLPIWFYLPAFLGGFFPWSVFAPAALLDRDGRREDYPACHFRRFLIVWAIAIFVLFSIAGSKLVSYILPMYAPAALLVGDWLQRRSGGGGNRRPMIAGLSVAVLFTAVPALVLAFQKPVIQLIETVAHQPAKTNGVPPEFVPIALALAGAAALGTVLAFAFALARRPRAAVSSLIAGMTLFVAVALGAALPVIDSFFSKPLHDAAIEAGSVYQPGMMVAVMIGPPRRPSVFFYFPDGSLEMIKQWDRTSIEEIKDTPLSSAPFGSSTNVVLTEESKLGLIHKWRQPTTEKRNGKWAVLTFRGRAF